MSIQIKDFGKTTAGQPVKVGILANDTIEVHILSYGATIQQLLVPDRKGNKVDVVLGYPTVQDYELNTCFLGAVVGRYANRIGGSKFTLYEEEYHVTPNEGKNCLHSGLHGFDKTVFDMGFEGDDTLVLTAASPDGTDGFPGNAELEVRYSLAGTGLMIQYTLTTDAPTVANITNHSYFNLNGHCSGDIRGHTLRCPVTGSFNQLTEESAPLFEGTDLNEERVLGEIFDCRYPSLEAMGGGIDHKFILSNLSANLKDAGTLYSPESGIEMQCTTTMPCIMIYTGNMVDIDGKNHFHYGKHAGVCFETMLFSSLRDMYGSVAVIEPGKEHRSCTRFTFSLR